MKHQKTRNSSFKIIVFIVLGGASIIMADLFILNKNQHIWGKLDLGTSYESADVSSIRLQHDVYMVNGINIEPGMLSSRTISKPPMPLKRITKNDMTSPDILSLDTLIAKNKVAKLAKIEPALGFDEEISHSLIKVGFRPLVDKTTYEDEKDVSDILSELGAGKKIITDIQPVFESAEVAKVIEQTTAVEKIQYSEPKGTGMVVIIIDDMGVTLRSKQVEVLPGPLTLSYLPYAENLNERTKRASQNGHELMLHMPMEPLNGKLDGGPNVLKTSQSEEDFIKTLEWGMSSFDGFVGINNHMGSRLTRDKRSMQLVMKHLKNKNLFFIDSKTIGSSVAASTAREIGIPYARRDVFLDHEMTPEFVRNALKELEETAYKQGYAIAIGHPHKETIAALKEWLPTLKDKGLTLVPASQVIKRPNAANDNLIAGAAN